MLVLALILWTASGVAFAEEKGPAPPIPEIGDGAAWKVGPGAIAPGFVARGLDGETFRFEVERDRYPYLLVFWSIFCEPCRLEMPVVQKIYDKYRNSGLRVVAVAMDGGAMERTVSGFVRQEGYTFPVLVDDWGAGDAFAIGGLYGITGIPTTLLVEKGGRVAFVRTGRITEEELDKSLQSALGP